VILLSSKQDYFREEHMQQKTNDFNIKLYWGMILEKKYIALAVALAVLSVFTWGSFILPKTYEAESVVAVEKGSIIDPLIKGVGVSSSLESGLSNIKNHMTSRNIIERVMKKIDLDVKAKQPGQYEAIVEGIRNNLNVKVLQSSSRQADSGTALLIISYKGTEPKTVRDIVNTLVSEYIEENMGYRTSDVQGAYEFIKNQLLEYKVKVEESDKVIREFREKNPHMIPQNETSMLGKIETLQTAKMESDIRLKELIRKKENIQKQLTGEKELTVAFVTREGTPQARLSYLNNQLVTLTAKYTENYPEVIKVKHEIEELKKGIAREKTPNAETGGSETSSINPIYQQLREELSKTDMEIESLRTRVAELSRQQRQLEQRLGQMPKEQEEWSKLQRDRNVSQKIYDELLQKLENAKVSKDLEVTNKGGSFRVVDPAVLPLLPAKPNRVMMILLGLLFGSLSGIGAVLGLEYLKPSFKDEGSIETLLKVPVLATIPQITTEEDKLSARKQDRRVFIATAAYLFIIGLVLTREFLYRYAGVNILNF
jgi:polysaccharide chain length determinant protein (PEP-CTERM system associated)